MFSLARQPRRLFVLQRHIPNSWKKLQDCPQSNIQACSVRVGADAGDIVEIPVESAASTSEVTLTKTPFESPLDSLLSSIKSHSCQNHLSEAFKVYFLLRCHPSSSSFHLLNPLFSLLVCCTNIKSLFEGNQLHAHILSLGFEQDPLLVPKLVNFYLSFDSFVAACTIVHNLNECNVLPWNLLISAYVKHGFFGEAISVYKEMVKRGVQADRFTYPSVLKACGDVFDMDTGREIHRSINSNGLEWNLFVQNALMGMYVKCGSFSEAQCLFDRMPQRDVVSWNTMISAYAWKGMWKEAFELFEWMQESGIDINSVTWNTIVGGNVKMGNYLEALKLISNMSATGSLLDSVSMVIGLVACARVGSIISGREIHCFAIRRAYDKEEGVKNALITVYCQCEHLNDAYLLFRRTVVENVVTWNCMISGYSNLDRSEESFFLFREMVSSGMLPNYVTVASVLPLCARIADLQHGKELHCYIIKQNFKEYLLIWNALVDMYSKSGRIMEAHRVFDLMDRRDAVTYTSLIAGYGMQGKGQTALKLFHEMNKFGIKPDHINMVAVLSACSHSGMVTCGQVIFEKMISAYGVTPRLEHYACMVDLYGRAGLLKKAEEVLSRIPFQPSPAMWATLIGACLVHRNMEIGEWAAKNLLEMRPQNPGHYVLIANMYATAGNWSKLAEVRTLMRDMGLRKDPGCTWIGVGNEYHPFLVGDTANARAKEIYLWLEKLTEHMNFSGYVADMDSGLEEEIEACL